MLTRMVTLSVTLQETGRPLREWKAIADLDDPLSLVDAAGDADLVIQWWDALTCWACRGRGYVWEPITDTGETERVPCTLCPGHPPARRGRVAGARRPCSASSPP